MATTIAPSNLWISHAGTDPQVPLKAPCDSWMEIRKTDLRYIPVHTLNERLETFSPNLIVDMDGSLSDHATVHADITWNLPALPPENDDETKALARQVEARVKKLIASLKGNDLSHNNHDTPSRIDTP